MWDHLPAHNLITLQQIAALKHLERQITTDHNNGYPTDHLLDQYQQTRRTIERGGGG